jgi:mRNA-degrading endonuclease toxin of MazEF toxin-antitoxin module
MPRPSVLTGGMYYVEDSLIRFPGEGAGRTPHVERRVVVVISGAATASDTGWPFVVVCPFSSQTKLKTRFCVPIPADQAPSLKKTWVRVPALSPLAKTDLQDFIQPLSEDRFREVQARVAQYLGFLDDAPSEA